MRKTVALLLMICCEVVSGTIHNLDDIFKDSAAKVLRTEIEAVDLSDVTIIFSNKVQYGEPIEFTNDVIDTITEEYDESSGEGQTEVFEKSFDHENQISWILDEGLLASTTPQVQVSIEDEKGFDISVVIADEEQKRLEQTSTKELTKKADVKVPAGSKVSVAWNIVEKELEIPWTVEVEISGNLKLTCDKKCSNPLPIDTLLRRAVLPSGIFKSTSGKLTFLAKGYLVTVLAYSDELKIETESVQGEEPEIEEEATEDDVGVADKDPTLTVVKGILDIAANNLDEESQWRPWIKMAGGIADLSAGKTDDPQVYLDIAESAIDIVNSEQGQNAIEKLKNITNKVINKVKGKAETENEKCKGKRNTNKPGCPSRNQPAAPPRQPGQPVTRKPRLPSGGTTAKPRPGRTPLPRQTTQTPGRRVTTRKPSPTKRTTARSTPGRTTARPTPGRTTKSTTKKTTKKTTTKRKTTKKTTRRRG